MTQHYEELVLPYKPKQLFNLVMDIEKYPEFLPWCKDLRIVKREQNRLTAELTIGYKFFQEKFRCIVTSVEQRQIKANYVSGPLKSLGNEWEFVAAGRGKTLVKFAIHFEFKGMLFQKLAETLFQKIFKHMVRAFEKRAAEIYT